MRYDLHLICELCDEIGLPVRLLGDDCAELDLGQGALLQFQNAEDDKDCLAGFSVRPGTRMTISYSGATATASSWTTLTWWWR